MTALEQQLKQRPAKTLGGRVRMAAAAKGLDKRGIRSALEKAGLKLTRQTVQKWWDDRVKYVEPDYLFPLCAVLGVDPEWLQLGEVSPVPRRQLKPEEERVLAVYGSLSPKMRSTWLRTGEDHLAEVGATAANPYPKQRA